MVSIAVSSGTVVHENSPQRLAARDDPFEPSSSSISCPRARARTQESEPPSAVMSQARSSMSQADKVRDLLRAARE